MVNVTLSPFVPKSHTPFQWEGQASREEIRRRMNYIRDHMPQRGVGIKTSPIDTSILEGALARGDRRLGAVIERAWREGCRFDGWSEQFRPDTWRAAFVACGLDMTFYNERVRADDEVFPYDHIESGPGKKYLTFQRDQARASQTTPDCVNNPCSGCKACKKPKEHVLAREDKTSQPDHSDQTEKPDMSGKSDGSHKPNLPQHSDPANPQLPVMRVRLRFTKSGPLRFIGHLDMMEAIHRVLRRTSAPLAYSHGFNPQPVVSLSPPLPLGFEGKGELADVFLLRRIDLREWLREITSMPIGGLEWTAIEEIPLKVPSLQQAITHYNYEVSWRPWTTMSPDSQPNQDLSPTSTLSPAILPA